MQSNASKTTEFPRNHRGTVPSPSKMIPIESPRNGSRGKTDEEIGSELSRLVGSVLDESEGSVRQAADEIGLRVVTKKQFKIMEWGTKQLRIRRLQDECDRLLKEIGSPQRDSH
jgi:hypothetical protein